LAVLVAAFAAGTSSAVAAVQAFPIQLEGADPDGSGVAIVRVDPDRNRVCYTIVVRNIGEPAEPPASGLGAAHIHVLPTGGIAVDLDAEFRAAGRSGTYIADDCVDADSATIDALLANPASYYVNVHTAEFPGGAVQGSLG
jgi:hypothetical protein